MVRQVVCSSFSHSNILVSLERFAPLALVSEAVSTGLLLILNVLLRQTLSNCSNFFRACCSCFSKFELIVKLYLSNLRSLCFKFPVPFNGHAPLSQVLLFAKFGSPFRAFLLVFLSFSAASYAQVSVEQAVSFAPNGTFRK